MRLELSWLMKCTGKFPDKERRKVRNGGGQVVDECGVWECWASVVFKGGASIVRSFSPMHSPIFVNVKANYKQN